MITQITVWGHLQPGQSEEDYESNIVFRLRTCLSLARRLPRTPSLEWRCSNLRGAGRQLGVNWHWSMGPLRTDPIWMSKLPICDLHVAKCIFATEIEFEKNPCYKLPLTLSDMNVRRKFQSCKPGMQLLFKKLSGGLRLTWQISAGLSPVIAMLTLSSSPL